MIQKNNCGHLESTLELIKYLAQQGGHHQILGLIGGNKASHPYYHDGNDELTKQVLEDFENEEYDTYLTLNPVIEPPKYQDGTLEKVKAKHITCYRRFMLDIDGDAAEAEAIKDNLIAELRELGITPEWEAYTGNGWQIILRLADLPNENSTTEAIKDFVAHFAEKHDTDTAHLDDRVSDVSRLGRLPGTMRFKGGDGIRGRYKLYDDPTILTQGDLEKYWPAAPRASKRFNNSIPTKSRSNSGDLYVGKMSIEELRQKLELQNVTTIDAPIGFSCSFRVECPQGRSTSCKLLFTLSGRFLKVDCKHTKCAELSPFDHLKALGVDFSRISSLFSFNPTALVMRWTALMRPEVSNIRHEDGQTTITKDDLVIIIFDSYVVLKDDKKKTISYQKLPAFIKSKIESELRSKNERLEHNDRIANQILATNDLVLFNGAMMEYDEKLGGYEAIEKFKPFVSIEAKAVTEADTKYLETQFGLTVVNQNITSSMVSAICLLIIAKVPQKTEYDFPYGANYSNGIWCAKTDRLVHHGPQHFVKPALSFEYDEDARSPRFDKLLSEIYPEPEQKQLYLEFLGNTHAGDSSHECMLLLVGPGAAGKGLVTSVAKKMVVKVASPSANDLTDKNGLATCIGAGMLIVNEATSLRERQVATLKMITGGDDLQIFRKYESSYDGPLVLNIWMLSNELVTFPDPSGAIMRRLKILIHQNVKPEGERDAGLKRDGLKDELPGIARLARDAYKSFKKQGKFTNNPHVDHLINAIEEDSSPVKKFIAERCVVGGSGLFVSRNNLYDAYLSFLKDFGRDKPSKIQFSYDLKAAAIGVAPGHNPEKVSERTWTGIKLKPAFAPKQ